MELWRWAPVPGTYPSYRLLFLHCRLRGHGYGLLIFKISWKFFLKQWIIDLVDFKNLVNKRQIGGVDAKVNKKNLVEK